MLYCWKLVCKFIILTWKTISTTWWVSSASCVFLYWLCWQMFVGLLISFSSLWSWTAFQWNYHESWMQQTYIICLSGEWPSSFHWKNTFTLLKLVFCAALSNLVSVTTKCPAAEGIICHQIFQWYYDCKKVTEINIVGILCNNSLSKNCRKPKFSINKN